MGPAHECDVAHGVEGVHGHHAVGAGPGHGLRGRHDPADQGGADGRIDSPHRIRRVDVERRHHGPLRAEIGRNEAGHGVGHEVLAVVVGVVGQVLDLEVHSHALAGLQGLGQAGHVVGQFVGVEVADPPAVGQVGVVVDHGHAVSGAAHVEFDPVGTEFSGQPEGFQRVLGRGLAGPPMRDHRCHPGSLAQTLCKQESAGTRG